MKNLKLKIAHQVPGRVRMKIPSGKGNPDLLRQVADAFGQIPGIERVAVNATTGSVVLHYDAERHDEFHGALNDHVDGPNGAPHAPPTEIDALADKIEKEAEFLAEHSASARAMRRFRQERRPRHQDRHRQQPRPENGARGRRHRRDGSRNRRHRRDAGLGHAVAVRDEPLRRDASDARSAGAGARRGALALDSQGARRAMEFEHSSLFSRPRAALCADAVPPARARRIRALLAAQAERRHRGAHQLRLLQSRRRIRQGARRPAARPDRPPAAS